MTTPFALVEAMQLCPRLASPSSTTNGHKEHEPMRTAILIALTCALAGGLWAEASANPLAEYTFSDQKSRSLADYPGQSVAIWGMCKP